MYIKYGSYQHDVGECGVIISRAAEVTENDIFTGYTERWDINGRLQGADAAAITTAIVALEAAYAVQGQSLSLYNDDNSLTAHSITATNSTGGARAVGPPSYPEGDGAEYTTFRNFTITLEAKKLLRNLRTIEFQETLVEQGGGSRWAYQEPITGLPQRQQTNQFTTFKATQTGYAIGLFGPPAVPGPLFPYDEHTDQRQIVPEAPQRSGPYGKPVYKYYRTSWTYIFESARPLLGTPNVGGF